MEHREILSFGEPFGEPFRLEIRLDSQGQPHLTLFRGQRAVKHLLKPSLALLRYLAEHPKEELLEADILEALWPRNVDPYIVEKHISFLRAPDALNDDFKNPRFIATLPKRGYKFLLDVRREGDIGGIKVYPKWIGHRFLELLSSVERGSGSETEDLRIVTTGFSCGVGELQLDGLIKKDVRVKILMMNPQNDALVQARYSLREDKTPQTAVRELKDQIGQIEKLARLYPPEVPGEHKGNLQMLLSDMTPSGFVVHTGNWALLGIFLAHDSYVGGPMLEIRSDTDLWEKLRIDWDRRWTDAQKHSRRKNRTT